MASGIPELELVPSAGVFVKASCSSEWYENLQPRGSCFSLLSLLLKQHEMIHELGPKGITVLHKGVQHGCVALVKFILVNMFDDEGYCTCRECGRGILRLTREQLLRKVCEDDITAVQMAVVSGSPKMVLLLKWAIDKIELEVKQRNKSSSERVEGTCSGFTLVRIQRARQRTTRNALLFAGEAWDKEGEDMRRLFEVGNIEDCDPSTPTALRPADAEGEVVEETSSESVNDTDCNNVVVPDVKDDTIDCVYEVGSEESVMIPRVYDVIESVLEDLDCFEVDVQEKVKMWKDKCMKDVDFEFVPVAHVFLHFLSGSEEATYEDFRPNGPVYEIFGRIIRACYEHDLKEQRNPQGSTSEGSGCMVATLFKILDPRGRTFLHANVGGDMLLRSGYFGMLDSLLETEEMPTSLTKECMNSTDGAGRTIVHLMCILQYGSYSVRGLLSYKCLNFKNIMDCDAELSPLCREELDTVKNWCFPRYKEGSSVEAIHLAILFDSVALFKCIYVHSKKEGDYDVELNLNEVFHFFDDDPKDLNFATEFWFQPIQLAAFLGRPTIIEEILKQPKLKPIIDKGIDAHLWGSAPAIHHAALSGQVEAIQSILKFPIYDPFVQSWSKGTALHYLLKRKNFKMQLSMFETLALLHVLPNSKSYAHLKDEFSKLYFYSEREVKMFSADEISCINLLLQAGIDIWTPNCETNELPSPGPMHNDAAREWWYNKVVNEVVIQKSSINNASNATSVIATLVTTASVIGPLQPPLGLAEDGYLHTSASAVRMYFVCNGLSFYFSIASILMAVLPAIPMPKESLYDELFRSQRCLKAAVLLLLVAIMCLLLSFTFASFAVVSLEQHNLLLVGGYVGIGGVVCSMVLVAYMIRMLRMVFHKNDRFRRWFAKYMKF